MGFEFANPWWLVALIPAAAAIIFYAREKTALTGARKAIWLTIRSLVFLFVILALAGLQFLWPIQQTSTVFVADRSHSMGPQEDAEKAAINDALAKKSAGDQAAVVTVGAGAEVERPLTNQKREVSDFQAPVNPDYTNLAGGLELGGSLFDEHARGRVVLMTDGNENIGNVKQAARYLHEEGYVVDVMPFDVKHGKDVAVTGLDVPQVVYAGEKVPLMVTVKSTEETDSHLRIYEDRHVILNQNVHLKAGTNQFSFQHLSKKAGFHTYRAEILTNGDKVVENDNLSAFSEAKGLPRVLIVEGKQGAAHNLIHAFKSSAVRVTVTEPERLPTRLSGYLNYNSIVFANVSAPDVSGGQMKLIARAVKDFGVGFIMTGGKQSFGPGGYFKTPIENVLPVRMDLKGERKQPSLGLVIVLDKSGSMEDNKIEMAREAAARSVSLLRPDDTLGVIAFDEQPWQVVKTSPIGNRKKVEDQIRSITADGGTEIFPSLKMAYEQIKPLNLQRKHIILLTDGQSETSNNWQQMIENGQNDKITLSTVAVGTDADIGLLQEMAKNGGGRFYNVQDVSSIPTIFSRETSLVTRTYIVDHPFYPKLVNGYNWEKDFADGVPKMNAYIATSAKERAQQILVSEKNDPVLARWQYGLGKTVAWTTDLTGKWSGGWPAWKNWAPLWNDIVTWTFPQYDQAAYDITKTMDGNRIKLNITSEANGTEPVHGRVVNEKGNPVDFSLRTKAPATYEGSFQAKQSGIYYLQLSGKNSRFQTGIVVPYSQEYALQSENKNLLEQVAKIGGGKVLKDPKDAFADNLSRASKPQDLFDPLLVVALILFLLDVAVRRFQVSFAFVGRVLTIRERKRETESAKLDKQSSRMEQLKRAGSKRTKLQQSIRKPASNQGTDPPKSKTQKQKQTKPSKPEKQSSTRQERMARLLDAKNKRKNR